MARRRWRADRSRRPPRRLPERPSGREFGIGSAVAAPITVEDAVWGILGATTHDHPLPAGTERRLTQFAELVAAALANAQARAEVQQLADEQAALRRVAELVARGVAPAEVFAAVAVEASRLLGDVSTALVRFDEDGASVAVSQHGGPAGTAPPVAAPITVEGRRWGEISALAAERPLAAGTAHRLKQFADLVAAAIANAEHRAQLTASRARVVATADETRRQLQRDVHDGAQQRLVQTVMTLKLAKGGAGRRAGRWRTLLDESLDHAQRATDELRDLVRGILPAALTRGGLRAGDRVARRRHRAPGRGAGHRTAAPGRHGDDRLLRRRRGADERRQALRGPRARTSAPASRPAPCGSTCTTTAWAAPIPGSAQG